MKAPASLPEASCCLGHTAPPPPGSSSLKPMGEMSPVPNQMPPKCVIAKCETAGWREAGVYKQTPLPVTALMGSLSPDGHPLASLHLAEPAEKHVAGWSAGDVPLGDVTMEGTYGAVYSIWDSSLLVFSPTVPPPPQIPNAQKPKLKLDVRLPLLLFL